MCLHWHTYSHVSMQAYMQPCIYIAIHLATHLHKHTYNHESMCVGIHPAMYVYTHKPSASSPLCSGRAVRCTAAPLHLHANRCPTCLAVDLVDDFTTQSQTCSPCFDCNGKNDYDDDLEECMVVGPRGPQTKIQVLTTLLATTKAKATLTVMRSGI